MIVKTGRKVIANIILKVSEHRFVAVADNAEYDLTSENDISIGDFIWCNVIADENTDVDPNDESYYYLLSLEDANLPLSNKEEWQKQEDIDYKLRNC